MLALSTTIAAAAYLLLGQPGNTGAPVLVVPPVCQFPGVAARPTNNHLTVRWVGGRHHRRCYRWRHTWRCR